MKYLGLFAFSGILAMCAAPAGAQSTSIRHLVYNFDVSLSTTSTVHDSGIDGGPVSGASNYHASTGDQGTIVIDVKQVQPDTGLVVQVSEQGRGTRSSEPTMCVTYGNGTVICDQSKGGPTEEEMALLRLVGRNFINRTAIANNSWTYSSSTPQASETTNYHIDKDANGLLGITYQRVLKISGSQAANVVTDGSMTYNEKQSVPTTVTEDTMNRKSTGMGNYDESRQQMTFTLATDSLATTAGH